MAGKLHHFANSSGQIGIFAMDLEPNFYSISLGQQAQGYGIEIWLEVHGKDSNLPGRICKMMEFAGHPMVGICWNSNPEDVQAGSVKSSFELLKPWLRNVHINELWQEEYPWRELFSLLKAAEYNRYTL